MNIKQIVIAFFAISGINFVLFGLYHDSVTYAKWKISKINYTKHLLTNINIDLAYTNDNVTFMIDLCKINCIYHNTTIIKPNDLINGYVLRNYCQYESSDIKNRLGIMFYNFGIISSVAGCLILVVIGIISLFQSRNYHNYNNYHPLVMNSVDKSNGHEITTYSFFGSDFYFDNDDNSCESIEMKEIT